MVYTLASGTGGAVEQLTRRAKVTIDGSKVASETAIPLMLNINLPGVKTAGADVRVAKLDGTPIAREIECIDVPNTDDVALYLPFDTVSGTDSQFYVYWAPGSALTEPAANSTYGSQAVWDSNFKGVWHMNHDPNGDAANSMKDSTSNANHGSPEGSMTTADLINAPYGKGIDLDGGDDRIACNGVVADTDLTESGLVLMELYVDKTYETNDSRSGFCTDSLWSNYFFFRFDDDMPHASIMLRGANGTYPFAQVAADKSGLHYHTAKKDGEDAYYFVDGSQVASDTTSKLSANIAATSFDIGRVYSTTFCMKAKVYEVRVTSGSIRSNGYISTTYNNINNPTATGTTPFFKSIGIPEHQRRTPTTM